MISRYRSTAETTGRYSRFSRLAIPLSVIAGLVISLALFFVTRAWDDSRFQIAFERESRQAISTLKEGIDNHLDVLRALRAFYESSDEIKRQEFRVFAGDFLRRQGGLQAVEWIPKVPERDRGNYEEAARRDGLPNFRFTERDSGGMFVAAGPRENYYPVYYVEPHSGNEGALGFDLGSTSVRRETLLRCRDSGTITATPPVRLVQESGHQKGLLVFLPVYRKGAPVNFPESRVENLEGFYLVVIRLEDFLNSILQHHHFSGINVCVFEKSDYDNDELLYFRSFGENGTRTTESPKESNTIPGLFVSEHHSVGGRDWSILATPTQSLIATRRTWIPWMALATGVIMTALMTTYLVQVRKGAETARVRLEEQTRAREDLEREADKRTVAERTLRGSEQKFRAIFENDHVIMLIFDPITGQIDDANPAACSFYGWSRDELKE